MKNKIDKFYESLKQTQFFNEEDVVREIDAGCLDKETNFDRYLNVRRKYIQKLMCIEKSCKKHGDPHRK